MRTLVTISDQAGDGENGALIIYSDNYSRGAAMIVAERYRVMDIKGRTIEQDQRYEFEELPDAAMAYLIGGSVDSDNGTLGIPDCWPFNPSHYKGAQDRIADLIRAGQFIAAEIDRLTLLAKQAKNPTRQTDTSSLAPASVTVAAGRPKGKLIGFRSDGDRLEANPETLSLTAKVFEPGTGSDPATWFENAPSCCCATNEPGTRCYRCKEGLHETCSDSGANPRPRKHIHDSDTAYDGVCKDCDPTQAESNHPAFSSQYHDGRRILRCDKSRKLGHEEHNWESSFLPVWCPGYVATPEQSGD